MDRKKPVAGEFYRHFKGNIYQVKMLARDCATSREVVVYQGMYAPYQYWVRDLQEFMSEVERSKYPDILQKNRFEKVLEKDLVGESAKTGAAEVRIEKEPQSDEKESGVKEQKEQVDYNNSDINDDELLKALKTGQPERYLTDRISESEIALRGFMQLLDAKTFHEKRQIFIGLKQYLDKRMLSNIAVALDIVLEEGSREEQYESVLRCLEAFARYEGGRLR